MSTDTSSTLPAPPQAIQDWLANWSKIPGAPEEIKETVATTVDGQEAEISRSLTFAEKGNVIEIVQTDYFTFKSSDPTADPIKRKDVYQLSARYTVDQGTVTLKKGDDKEIEFKFAALKDLNVEPYKILYEKYVQFKSDKENTEKPTINDDLTEWKEGQEKKKNALAKGMVAVDNLRKLSDFEDGKYTDRIRDVLSFVMKQGKADTRDKIEKAVLDKFHGEVPVELVREVLDGYEQLVVAAREAAEVRPPVEPVTTEVTDDDKTIITTVNVQPKGKDVTVVLVIEHKPTDGSPSKRRTETLTDNDNEESITVSVISNLNNYDFTNTFTFAKDRETGEPDKQLQRAHELLYKHLMAYKRSSILSSFEIGQELFKPLQREGLMNEDEVPLEFSEFADMWQGADKYYREDMIQKRKAADAEERRLGKKKGFALKGIAVGKVGLQIGAELAGAAAGLAGSQGMDIEKAELIIDVVETVGEFVLDFAENAIKGSVTGINTALQTALKAGLKFGGVPDDLATAISGAVGAALDVAAIAAELSRIDPNNLANPDVEEIIASCIELAADAIDNGFSASNNDTLSDMGAYISQGVLSGGIVVTLAKAVIKQIDDAKKEGKPINWGAIAAAFIDAVVDQMQNATTFAVEKVLSKDAETSEEEEEASDEADEENEEFETKFGELKASIKGIRGEEDEEDPEAAKAQKFFRNIAGSEGVIANLKQSEAEAVDKEIMAEVQGFSRQLSLTLGVGLEGEDQAALDKAQKEAYSIDVLIAQIKKDQAIVAAVNVTIDLAASAVTTIGGEIFEPLKAVAAGKDFMKHAIQAVMRQLELLEWQEMTRQSKQSGSSYSVAIASRLSEIKIQVSEKTIEAILDLAKFVGAVSASTYMDFGAGKALGAAVKIAEVIKRGGFKLVRFAKVEAAWYAYKKAHENPEDRKWIAKAIKWNATIGKYAIAYGAFERRETWCVEVCRRVGITQETLAQEDASVQKVATYLKLKFNEDINYDFSDRISFDGDWRVGAPQLTFANWTENKLSAETDGGLAKTLTGAVDKAFSDMAIKETEFDYATAMSEAERQYVESKKTLTQAYSQTYVSARGLLVEAEKHVDELLKNVNLQDNDYSKQRFDDLTELSQAIPMYFKTVRSFNAALPAAGEALARLNVTNRQYQTVHAGAISAAIAYEEAIKTMIATLQNYKPVDNSGSPHSSMLEYVDDLVTEATDLLGKVAKQRQTHEHLQSDKGLPAELTSNRDLQKEMGEFKQKVDSRKSEFETALRSVKNILALPGFRDRDWFDASKHLDSTLRKITNLREASIRDEMLKRYQVAKDKFDKENARVSELPYVDQVFEPKVLETVDTLLSLIDNRVQSYLDDSKKATTSEVDNKTKAQAEKLSAALAIKLKRVQVTLPPSKPNKPVFDKDSDEYKKAEQSFTLLHAKFNSLRREMDNGQYEGKVEFLQAYSTDFENILLKEKQKFEKDNAPYVQLV